MEILAEDFNADTYCLHVTLARRLHALAPGLTPRSVLEKFRRRSR
jgi:hypothetical protein